jgi:phage shock protein PspC (stress-responsive transcriptional regulator)
LLDWRIRKRRLNVGIQGVLEGLVDNDPRLHGAVVPFLCPPSAKWPQFVLEANAFGCNFGHLVCADSQDRCEVYVQAAASDPGTALFRCVCQHWKDRLDMPAFDGIIGGLDSAWGVENWSVVLLFCTAL